MRVEDIFTPGKYPEYTYVKRRNKQFEQNVKDGLRAGELVSVSGPSKSGKTVLVQNVVGEQNLVPVRGVKIDSVEDLWNQVLDELEYPSTTEATTKDTNKESNSLGGKLSGKIFGSGGEVSSKKTSTSIEAEEDTEVHDRSGLRDVINIIDDQQVVFIDDFHYIDRETQREIAQSLKEALFRGVPLCVALVPHRSEDIERANSDLRGRVTHIDMDYWETSELELIAERGFNKMNIDTSDGLREILALEAAGSPHLMQKLCLEVCRVNNINSTFEQTKHVDLDYDSLVDVFRRTADNTRHGDTFDILDTGPKTRGKKRNTYNFIGGNDGDVYRCLIRAIAADPPKLTFKYNELKSRTEQQCVSNEAPRGRQIMETCEQMDGLLREKWSNERYLDWDQTREILAITDPYLLFYIRWSERLNMEVGKEYQKKLS